MATLGSIIIGDYDREKSTVSVNLADIGYVGATYLTETQNLDEIRSANLTKTFPESQADVTNKNAQRERKWLVQYFDNKQFLDGANLIPNPSFLKNFTFEIPTADASLVVAPDADFMDITAGVGATLKSTLESNYRSPAGGTITVTKVQLVGRNS
jgi:hypothetical protein